MQTDFQFNYDEDLILAEIEGYLQSTYGEHYAGDREIQVFDIWEEMDILTPMCIGTAMKYLSRYGRKEGNNRKDLLKAIHYIILALYSEQDSYEDVKGKAHPGTVAAVKASIENEQAQEREAFGAGAFSPFGPNFQDFLQDLMKARDTQ